MVIATIIGLSALLMAVHGSIIVYTQIAPHSIMEEFRDMPADFGPDIPLDGLRGFLVAGEPSDGCTNMTKPPVVQDNFTDKWIVLVAKHTSACTYEQQVRNAQTAGYDLAIVHNVNSSELEVMTADNPDGISIPSVFVSDLAGLILSEEYLYDKGFYIMVNSEEPFNINTHLLLPFAIVCVLCLLVILIFMIVKCIKDRRRRRRHRLPNRALRQIPTCKFSKGDPYETCAICLDDYQEGEKLRVLPCAHAYHSVCIDPWLTQNKRVCPVCKRRVFAAGERRRLDSDSGSDSDDTAPLLADPPRLARPVTQGGTFDEQRENPFARATRFMTRLHARARRSGNAEVASLSSDDGHTDTHNNIINSGSFHSCVSDTDETEPLVQPAPADAAPAVASAETERRPRRARAARSARAARAARTPAYSINTTGRGEIGVAALPAAPPALPAAPPALPAAPPASAASL